MERKHFFWIIPLLMLALIVTAVVITDRAGAVLDVWESWPELAGARVHYTMYQDGRLVRRALVDRRYADHVYPYRRFLDDSYNGRNVLFETITDSMLTDEAKAFEQALRRDMKNPFYRLSIWFIPYGYFQDMCRLTEDERTSICALAERIVREKSGFESPEKGKVSYRISCHGDKKTMEAHDDWNAYMVCDPLIRLCEEKTNRVIGPGEPHTAWSIVLRVLIRLLFPWLA